MGANRSSSERCESKEEKSLTYGIHILPKSSSISVSKSFNPVTYKKVSEKEKNKWKDILKDPKRVPKQDELKTSEKTSFPIFNEDLINAQDHLKRNKSACKVFLHYLNDEIWVEQVQNNEKYKILFDDSSKSSHIGISKCFNPSISALNLDVVTQSHNFLDCFPKENRIFIVISCIFSFFSDNNDSEENSKKFKNSNKFENSKNEEIDYTMSLSFDSGLDKINKENKQNNHILNPFLRSLKNEILKTIKIESNLTNLISSGEWVNKTINGFDLCAIDLCISKIDKNGTKFPIIYANKSFKKSFNLKIEEVIGNDFFHILKKWSNHDKIFSLIESIQENETAEAYIPCSYGTEKFLNFVKLETFFSKNNEENEFVICGQIDVSGSKWDANNLKMIDEVLWTLKKFL